MRLGYSPEAGALGDGGFGRVRLVMSKHLGAVVVALAVINLPCPCPDNLRHSANHRN